VVELYFREYPAGLRDLPLLTRIRLRTHVILSTAPTAPVPAAVIDTGAPLSLFPRRLWQRAQIRFFEEDTEAFRDFVAIRGLDRRAPRLSCQFGSARIAIFDLQGNSSGWLEVPAYLSDRDDITFTLGFAGFLDRGRLLVDYPARRASIDLHG